MDAAQSAAGLPLDDIAFAADQRAQDLGTEGIKWLATSIAMTVGGHRPPKRPDAPLPFLEPTICCLRF